MKKKKKTIMVATTIATPCKNKHETVTQKKLFVSRLIDKLKRKGIINECSYR